MNVETAARRWAETWNHAWPARDVEAIASLYADAAEYRALVFREPDFGVAGIRRYLRENFGAEDDIECRFGTPVAAGDRAAVEWWATWIDDGQVVDHRDYWNQVERREPPYEHW